jgi:hypothetical protein
VIRIRNFYPALLAHLSLAGVAVEKVYATGRSAPVCGRDSHPLKSSAFHGALLGQLPPTPLRFRHYIPAYKEFEVLDSRVLPIFAQIA